MMHLQGRHCGTLTLADAGALQKCRANRLCRYEDRQGSTPAGSHHWRAPARESMDFRQAIGRSVRYSA